MAGRVVVAASVVSRALAALAVLVAAAGCAGSGSDKAGGDDGGTPTVLRLESEDDRIFTAAPEFAAAVERLSGGSLRIEFVQAGLGDRIDYERGVVDDVRRGKAQLGLVALRVWDRLGVTSFRGLLAPLLVDSLDVQERALSGPLAGRMLDGVDQAGVVGIALLPGPLRRPLGVTRAFLGPESYGGTTFGIRPGGVAEATARALGARPQGYVSGSLAGLDGAELDATTIAYNGYDRARPTLTANVVLWPKPYSLVMNRDAFARLTPAQRTLLRRAGREAVGPELRQVAHDDAEALAAACERGGLRLATASSADLAALHRAVQPLYRELARDPLAKDVLSSVARMRGKAVPVSAVASCAGAAAAGGRPARDPVEGRWDWDWTEAELVAAGISGRDVPGLVGSGTVEFDAGRFRGTTAPSGRRTTGTYEVDGDLITLTFDDPSPPGTVAGKDYALRWSRYRDTLAFERVPGREPLLAMLIEPFERAG
jgi:TRAP-type C4-dicarboxylate transport system substrate-binding protein